MNGHGFHWTPCHRGGGGIIAAVLAVAVIAAKRQAIEHAAWPLIRDVLILAAITVAVTIVGAVAAVAVRSKRALQAPATTAPRAIPGRVEHEAIEGRPVWPHTPDLFRAKAER